MDSPPALDGGREGVPSQDDAKAGKVIISIRDGARGGGMVLVALAMWSGRVGCFNSSLPDLLRRRRIFQLPAHDVLV